MSSEWDAGHYPAPQPSDTFDGERMPLAPHPPEIVRKVDEWWEARQAQMLERKIRRAAELGRLDRVQGVHRDMDDGDSAWLMDQLAETGDTTEANHAGRLAMCDAYARANRTPLARNVEDQPRVSVASYGHPRNADGECDCSAWPERNPHAHDGHLSCTPEGCVIR